jgi:molybdopterin molybdotransferase
MISIERGLEIVMSVASERARPDWMEAESVPLLHASSRILREAIVCDADSPPFDKAIRDGFAVRFEDVQNVPVTLNVIGESRAGMGAGVTIRNGECCEIMTGAPLPAGANAVVMVEHTKRGSADSVQILKKARENEGLLRQGAEARRGDRLLEPGSRIGLADIGLLASTGKASVLVSKKPRVCILATGDELVEVSATPSDGQIRNSNGYTLFAQSNAAGAEPILLGIARDNLDDLRAKIRIGLDSDVLLVSGGVSMGKYDLVENVFAEFGVQTFFDKIAIKPGKPTVFGFRERTFVFGLPGNPLSTLVAFHMFVRPVIHSLLKVAKPGAVMLEATLDAPAKCDPERAALVPANVRFEHGRYRIATAPWKGSSDLVGLSRANALILIPCREGVLQPGESAQFVPME